MPESTVPESLDATADESETALARRSVLTGAVVVGAGLLAPRAAASPRVPGQERLDALPSTVRFTPGRLTLKIDNSVSPPVPGQAVPLRITTTSLTATTLHVASTTANTTVGLHRDDAGQTRSVHVPVEPNTPVTVWVVPHKVGPHSLPGDQIAVSDGHDRVLVEVWIEPTGGQWEHAFPNGASPDLGIVAVHAALMRGRNGPEVVMYSPPRERKNGQLVVNPGADGETREKWRWNVTAMTNPESRTLDLNEWTTQDTKPDEANIFCSGASHLPDGRLLVAGGHLHHEANATANGNLLHCYDPKASPRWKKLEEAMRYDRWYPTVTPLPDGRMLITGGSYEGLWFRDSDYWGSIHNNYVIYDPVRQELTAAEDLVSPEPDDPPLATYPGVFVLPGANGGTVIAVVETNRAWLYTYEAGKTLKQVAGPLAMKSWGSRSYPWYGSSVLLPLHPGEATMNVLVVGGAVETSTNYMTASQPEPPMTQDQLGAQPTASYAELLELDLSNPLTPTGRWGRLIKTNRARFLCDATLLADGTVLVSGGAKQGWANNNSGPVNDAELFDPKDRKFRLAATATTPRRYHSVALLLPDGTVLKAGSNGGFGGPDIKNTQQWFLSRTDSERYLPPYLWRGPRPSIDKVFTVSSEVTLRHDERFIVKAKGQSLDDRAKVALIRLGATTHGNNMEQRYVWLDVSRRDEIVPDTWIIAATPPANSAAAPPGDYMLVVVDSNGVPSEAQLVPLVNRTS